MRTLATLLLATNLSVCSSTSSTPAESASQTVPKLRQGLSVSRQPAAQGEPIALVGRQKMMCAIRKDAPTACIGEIGLALEPVDPAIDDGRYARSHAERPVAIEGLDLRHLEVSDYARCTYEPGKGPVNCWWVEPARRKGQLPKPLPFENVRVLAAQDQTCVIGSTGEVRCTGDATCSGRDRPPDYDTSQIVTIPGVDKAHVVSRAYHMGCAVLEDSTVACWGKTDKGGECVPKASPVPDLEDVVDIAVTSYSACALRADNRVFCWGYNDRHQLGVADLHFSKTPIEVREAYPAVDIGVIGNAAAALRADGSVVAWGEGILYGEKSSPTVLDFSGPVVDFVVLESLVCGLLKSGAVECEGFDIEYAKEEGQPRPPFEGTTPWTDAPLYRLSAQPEK